MDDLTTEGFLPVGRPQAFGNQVLEPELFATAPKAGGSIDGHLLFTFLALSSCLGFMIGNDHPLFVSVERHLLQLPDLALPEAETGLVLQEDGVILGGLGDAGVGDDRHGAEFWIWWQIKATVHHGAERDISEIRWRTVIADDAIREHGKGARGGGVEQLSASHADAAAAIGMVHERELAVIGFGLLQRGKFPLIGAEGNDRLFLVPGSWCFVGRKSTNCHQRRTKNE